MDLTIEAAMSKLDASRLQLLKANHLKSLGLLIWDLSRDRAIKKHAADESGLNLRPISNTRAYSIRKARALKGTGLSANRPSFFSGRMWNRASMGLIVKTGGDSEVTVYFRGSIVARKKIEKLAGKRGGRYLYESARWPAASKAGRMYSLWRVRLLSTDRQMMPEITRRISKWHEAIVKDLPMKEVKL